MTVAHELGPEMEGIGKLGGGSARIDIAGDGGYDIIVIRAVVDTNVLVAAMKSSSGASHQILLAADAGRFEMAISVPLVAEYEAVASRPDIGISLPAAAIDAILDRICQVGFRQTIHYLWRPFLPDPKDDMVFETAFAPNASHLVTFNRSDFPGLDQFGIRVVLPRDFLALI